MVNKAIQLLQSARRSGILISVDKDQLSIKYSKERSIEPGLLEEIKSNKELIIDFLNNNKSNSKKHDAFENQIGIIKRDFTQQLPLSFSQERLWFIDQLEGSTHYHIPVIWRLKGNLNKNALSKALKEIINRHEVLRSVIFDQDGQGFQSVVDAANWNLEIVDGSLYTHNKQGLQDFIQQLIRKPFYLSKDYMLRAHLITLEDDEHILIINRHHIASDGWSSSVLLRELIELYNAKVEDRPAVLPALLIQYADYAIWQRNYLQGDVLDKKVGYWKEKLKDATALHLPTDYQRPAEWSNRGALSGFTIYKILLDQLHALSNQQGATLFMTLLAAFKILLHRYSGQEDICVGSPIANRTRKEVEGLIGFFVNTLALRSEVKSDMSFIELLQQVRTITMEAYDHQDVPFEKVVEVVVKERDMSRNPLFQVMLVMQNTPKVQELKLGEIPLLTEGVLHETAQFDITFSINESSDGLNGSVEYATDLYNESTIVRMMDHFKMLLGSIVKRPQQKIGKLGMLSAIEEHQLLVEFNDTAMHYPRDKTIVDLFEEQVIKTPDAIAVVFEQEQLSYNQLNEKANQLAHYLRDKGIGEETLVPICIERSTLMIIGLLGILKAGAAYVPIDPEYPKERVKFMLEDISAAVIISSKTSAPKLAGIQNLNIIELDTDWPAINKKPLINLQNNFTADRLAYVIYTSGSTGKPKGVMIEHASLINYVLAFTDYFSICPEDVVIQQASLSFDTSAEEIYPTLIAGGCICLIKEGGKDIDSIKKYIENNTATILSTTPMVIEWLNRENLNTGKLRYIISGGDVLHSSNINNLFHQVSIVNSYGPSETTIATTFKKINEISKASLIGKPIPNTAIYILDAHNSLCPIGVAGQICIGGSGLARGYLNRFDLTKEKFIPDFFSKEEGARMYKTGDLGRWLDDGNIEYMGRVDDQVKIRGYRIELAEVEAALEQSGLMSQHVVVMKENVNGNKQLVCYVVPKGGFDKESIVKDLKSKLPEYMIPTIWIELENLPTTPNGKVDKKALPDFDSTKILNENYIAPRNETDKIIAEIWQQVLDVENVGIKNNFFELGGHSLTILKLASKIRELGIKIEVKDFFKFQTIEQQSDFIKTSLKLLDTASKGKFVIPIQTEGNNIPLFALPEFLLYAEIGKYISKQQPFYSIEHSPKETEEAVVKHYISEIRKTCPHGPYGLMGYCGWGTIIREIAQKLIAEGDEVPVLVLTEYYSSSIKMPKRSLKFIRQKAKFIIKNLTRSGPFVHKRKFLSKQFLFILKFINRKFKKTGIQNNNSIDQTFAGKVILFQASETYGYMDDSHMGWRKVFTGDVKKYIIEGDHLEMMASPVAAAQMATILNNELPQKTVDGPDAVILPSN